MVELAPGLNDQLAKVETIADAKKLVSDAGGDPSAVVSVLDEDRPLHNSAATGFDTGESSPSAIRNAALRLLERIPR